MTLDWTGRRIAQKLRDLGFGLDPSDYGRHLDGCGGPIGLEGVDWLNP